MEADWRDEAASALAADHVRASLHDRIHEARPVALVMDDHRDTLAVALAESMTVTRWWRRAYEGRAATPWPPRGPFQMVALRLPAAKEERDMALELATGALARDGRLLVFGAKDEGVGSVARALEPRFVAVESVRVAKRCRVVEARGPTSAPSPVEPERFAYSLDLGIAGLGRWISFPGVFAHGRLDGGTRLLTDHLPTVDGGRVLDFGCGHGVLSGVLAARDPSLELVALDVDSVALEAVAINVPRAARVLSDGWPPELEGPFDLIVSNPPIHRGKAESLGVVEQLIEGAPERLLPKGELRIVVQRRLPVDRLLGSHFREIQSVADEGPWRVWSARRRYLRGTRDRRSNESRR